jgi:hypothetical protein
MEMNMTTTTTKTPQITYGEHFLLKVFRDGEHIGDIQQDNGWAFIGKTFKTLSECKASLEGNNL